MAELSTDPAAWRVDEPVIAATLHAIAEAAGPIALQHFRADVAVDNKADGGFDPVTVADRGVELEIRRIIAAEWPSHGIIGEEFATLNPDADWHWIIDPIDGTRAYVVGAPTWGILTGLRYGGPDGTMRAGLMAQPYTGERFWGSPLASYHQRGAGTPVRLATRADADLSTLRLSSTDPVYFSRSGRQDVLDALVDHAQIMRYGLDCYAYSLVAAGTLDAVVECGLATYDIAPLIPIIEGAGGCVTAWDGGPALNGGDVLASASPRLHQALLEIIARTTP